MPVVGWLRVGFEPGVRLVDLALVG
jgi:hypothetical protein